MVRQEVRTITGAKKRSCVYIVGGQRPEPLLGDRDAEFLGIVVFMAEGRGPTHSEQEEEFKVKKMREKSIPEKLRAAGLAVNTAKG